MSPNRSHSGVFVTGTGTDVGKTWVSAWLCTQTQTPYWKPIQTGTERDADTVARLSHTPVYPEIYHFSLPASPHWAAQQVQATIHLHNIQRPKACPTHQPLIIEGAGGVMVPINPHHTMLDVMAHLTLPVLVVAKNELGTINHTCLTIAALQQRNLSVLGTIFTEPNRPPGPECADNAHIIETLSGVPVLATLPHLETVSFHALQAIPLPNALHTALTLAGLPTLATSI